MLFRTLRSLGALSIFALLVGPSAASAAPMTYTLVSGSLDKIQLLDPLGGQTTPCPVGGAASCLTNAPLAIDAASITIDFGTNEVLDLGLLVASTGNLFLGGVNGYESVDFTGTSYQSRLPSVLTPGSGGQYNFAIIPGQVDVANLDMYMTGNVSGIADASFPNYSAATAPGGSFIMSGDQLTLRLTGVDIGYFVDPFNPTAAPILAKADFTFVAQIPEPTAALLFSMGFIVAAGATRRGRFTPAS
jgi:hypothetical protein